MAALPSMAMQRRHFGVALPVVVLLVLTFAFLLLPIFPLPFRQGASGAGLVVAGTVAATGGVLRVRYTRGRRRRSWVLLQVAAAVAIVGNVVAAINRPDRVASPSAANNITIAVALLIAIVALLNFPTPRRRGIELLLMSLDGVAVGAAMLLVWSVLVYPSVLEAKGMPQVDQVTAMVYPLLDVLLATVALLLVLRTRTDRAAFGLIAVGFVLYAASDLSFAVLTAEGRFELGSLRDLGWIAGYLVIGLSAWYPSPSVDAPPEDESGVLSTAYETLLVFAVLIFAGVVQVAFGKGQHGPQIVLWMVLLVAAGARQTVLTLDNATLRRGLERIVREQTGDLRRASRQNEVLLDSVGDGIYGVDHDGRVTFMNPAGAGILGYDMEELLGRRAHQEFHAPHEDGTPFPWQQCYITEAIRAGVLTQVEEDTYVCRDGRVFPVEISASPLVDREERLGAVVVFRDVTQRREVERLKNEFLSVVSHELRTPLTSIRGSLGLLGAGSLGRLTPQADRMVSIALDSSERLTRLINDILDIERIESGTLPMELEVREATELLVSSASQIEGLASATGVRVLVAPSSGLVMADADRIVQTLTNLLGNAVKFSPQDSIVRMSSRVVGTEVVFSVRDEGRGIPGDKLETVFERFEQVDSSDARQKGGSGLGLAISRGIIERHGGRIWADSQVGAGTTVSFTLPAVRPTDSDPTTDETAAPTVLVCDDDPATLEVLSAMIARHGYRPIPVTNGRQAVQRVVSERPAAVVLELLLSGVTGAEVLNDLKSLDRTRHIPVIVLSGLGPEADPAVAACADGWLVKPVSEQRLAQTVSIMVAGHLRDSSVLIVEDDDNLARVLRTLLTGHGLNVVHVRTVEEAVTQGLALRPRVIVLDLHLPDGDGSQVVSRLRELGPLGDTALIVYSAADVARDQRLDLELGRTVFLTKGRAGPERLEQVVLELLEGAPGREKEASLHE